jgi:hypothetical protein
MLQIVTAFLRAFLPVCSELHVQRPDAPLPSAAMRQHMETWPALMPVCFCFPWNLVRGAALLISAAVILRMTGSSLPSWQGQKNLAIQGFSRFWV